jgi:hypothetical protein
MSPGELLVLRETPTELLDKNLSAPVALQPPPLSDSLRSLAEDYASVSTIVP